MYGASHDEYRAARRPKNHVQTPSSTAILALASRRLSNDSRVGEKALSISAITGASAVSRTVVTVCTCVWIWRSGSPGSVSLRHASNSARSASLRNVNSVRLRSESDFLILHPGVPRCGLLARQAPCSACRTVGIAERRITGHPLSAWELCDGPSAVGAGGPGQRRSPCRRPRRRGRAQDDQRQRGVSPDREVTRAAASRQMR